MGRQGKGNGDGMPTALRSENASVRWWRQAATLLIASAFCCLADGAAAQTLAPFKDRLFAYPAVIEEEAGGTFRRYAYSEARDIDARDAIPERRVDRAYVDLGANRSRRSRTLTGNMGTVELFETGRAENAQFAVIFVHGRGGDRRLGDDDWSFGGNFNRLKNLAVRNDGVYYAPSFPDFAAGGMAALRTVIDHTVQASPGAPIVVACASMGSALCWKAANAELAAYLDGIVILGGAPSPNFTASDAFELRVPLFIAHGTRDSVYSWQDQRAAFDAVRTSAPNYPIRFALFDTGTHGTPIRMIDWRGTLNWILATGAAR